MQRWYRIDEEEIDVLDGVNTPPKGSSGSDDEGKHLRDLSSKARKEELKHSFINHCFMVFDDFGQNEEADENEILLYFHPDHPSVPVRSRLLLMGQVHGIIAFASSFVEEAEAGRCEHTHTEEDGSKVSGDEEHSIVIRMRGCKFAVKRVGRLLLVRFGTTRGVLCKQ